MIINRPNINHWQIKTQKTKIVFNDGAYVEKFLIPGLGEYEISGVEVEVLDRIYIFYSEDLVITIIDQNKQRFSADEIKKIGQCDILFLPVAGKNTMDVKSALKIISDTEPAIIIPMYYDDLSDFKKSEGISIKELDELKITKNDISTEQREMIVLK